LATAVTLHNNPGRISKRITIHGNLGVDLKRIFIFWLASPSWISSEPLYGVNSISEAKPQKVQTSQLKIITFQYNVYALSGKTSKMLKVMRSLFHLQLTTSNHRIKYD